MSAIYDAQFYKTISDVSLRSATIVLGLVFELFRPASLLDVGCGAGAWLQASQDLGLAPSATLGIDGAYVPAEQFLVDRSGFLACDLSQKVRLGRRFELVVSVEVAEHLPPGRARGFVEDLVVHGDVILFSAATPSQGGAHHVNEQWPDYWAALFAEQGYVQFDWIRPAIWANEDIAWWYRQNAMIYTNNGAIAEIFAPAPSFHGARLVHPERFAYLSRDQIVSAVGDKLNRLFSERWRPL